MDILIGVPVLLVYNLLIWRIPSSRWGDRVSGFVGFLLGIPIVVLVAKTGLSRWVVWLTLGSLFTWQNVRLHPEKRSGFDWDIAILGLVVGGTVFYLYLHQTYGFTLHW